MLTKIREKSQGAFSWLLLLIIVIPFTLWGIENYIKGGSEQAVASVGHKDFFQNDVNRAYQQYSQNFAGMGIAEEILKKQALDKLIKDEVLLQYTEAEGLVSADADTRTFIQDLDYFKVNGKFDKTQYKNWLAAQRLSSAEFTNRVKKSQVMMQFQRSIMDSSFVTPYDLDHFFKIQNQQREIAYVTLPLKPAQAKPTEEEIAAYYKQHQAQFQTKETMAIDYVTLSLANLAKDVKVTEAQLKSFYEEQKQLYTTKEQRKLSHILFAVSSNVDEKTALAKANAALDKLKNKSFESLANELSEDKSSASKGGDLGLFEPGTMAEKAFDQAASQLKLNEISKPIKTKYGYHLIKVTELVPAKVNPFDEVKADVTKAYQHKEAEANFYTLIDKITEVSYQNPDSLAAVADMLGVAVEKTKEFTRDSGEGIAKEKAVRSAAFSDEVLKGNNSEPVELGSDKVIVLRMSVHHPAATRDLNDVRPEIVAALLNEKAHQEAVKLAAELKKQLMAGKKLSAVADEQGLKVKTIAQLNRENTQIPAQIVEATFKAAKPVAGKPTVFIVAMPNGEQVVASLSKVTEGVMTESDKKQKALAEKNMANALGQTVFDAVINGLEADADVRVSLPPKQVQ
jgi:peptidyl-prolyl cis-trans isomerase D